jgi:hypothetical protein
MISVSFGINIKYKTSIFFRNLCSFCQYHNILCSIFNKFFLAFYDHCVRVVIIITRYFIFIENDEAKCVRTIVGEQTCRIQQNRVLFVPHFKELVDPAFDLIYHKLLVISQDVL